jgi:hypothetical protein
VEKAFLITRGIRGGRRKERERSRRVLDMSKGDPQEMKLFSAIGKWKKKNDVVFKCNGTVKYDEQPVNSVCNTPS